MARDTNQKNIEKMQDPAFTAGVRQGTISGVMATTVAFIAAYGANEVRKDLGLSFLGDPMEEGCTLRRPTMGEQQMLHLFGDKLSNDLLIRGCEGESQHAWAMKLQGFGGLRGQYHRTHRFGEHENTHVVSFYGRDVSDDYAQDRMDLRMVFIHEVAHAAQHAGILPDRPSRCFFKAVNRDRYDVKIEPGLNLADLCLEQQAQVVETYYGLIAEGFASTPNYAGNKAYGASTPEKTETIRLAVESVLPDASVVSMRMAWEREAVAKYKTRRAQLEDKPLRSAETRALPSPRL
jgi:hypothetical protein